MNISIWLIIALVGFPQISETIYTPALPNIVKGLETTPYLVEATLAIYFLGISLGVLLWGAISDHFGRRPVMLIGLIVYSISTFLAANTDSIESLLALRFFQALGGSVGSVITQTILRDAYDQKERAKLFAIISGALAFSPAIGPLIGGMISDFFSWRANFFLLAVFSWILILWTHFSLKETRPANLIRLTFSETFHFASSMMRSLKLWGHVLLISGTNGIIFGFYQEAPFVFIEQYGMQPTIYGCFGVLIAAATILASRFSYKMSHELTPSALIKLGTVSVLVGGITFLMTVSLSSLNSGLLFIILSVFLVFFGIGLIIPNSLSHALTSFQSHVGTAGSIFGGLYYLLIAASMWIMSMIHDGTSFPLPIYFLSLGLVIALGSYMTSIEKKLTERV